MPGPGFLSRFWVGITNRVGLAVPPTIVAIFLLRWAGLTASIPYWVLITLVPVAYLLSCAVRALWDEPTGWRLVAYIGVVFGVIGAVAYSTGWGPTLSVGFIFGAAYMLQVFRSAAILPVLGWAVADTGLGQLCIALGIAPSVVKPPLVQGLAGLGLLGMVITIFFLGRFAAQREQSETQLSQSERRFKALVQNASDIIVVTDSGGAATYVSPAFTHTLGYPAESAIGATSADILHPEDLAKLQAEAPSRQDFTGTWKTEIRLQHADGSFKWFEASVQDRLEDPDVLGIVANLHDITARIQAEQEVRQAHERFRSSFENAPIGMAVADLDGTIVRANLSYARILGMKVENLVGLSVHDLTHPDDREASEAEMHRHLLDGSEGYVIEKRYLHADGHAVWASVNVSCVRDSAGKPLHFIGQIEDITERRAYREQLAYTALHDPLTGLPNRVLFMDRLDSALSRSLRQSEFVAVFFLDLDRFKRMNDSLGHDRGDQLIQAVAQRLQASVRPADTVARFGGDEFVVLCEEVCDESLAIDLAQRLIASLESALMIDGSEFYITASVGVALGRHPASPERLLRDADTAMYRAKEKGRGTIELFVEQDDLWSTRRLQMGNDLHLALNRGEFELFYQPIVDLKRTALIGMEALIRWRHPRLGLLRPRDFLQLAEDIGLTAPLGRWVLEQACHQTAHWHSMASALGAGSSHQVVSVNISARQLADRNFAGQVADVVSDSGLDPDFLWMEITESSLVHDHEDSLTTVKALRDLGVHLTIDDFGTGYSSLLYLQRFPVECLKIDAAFIGGLGKSYEAGVITSSVISLARSLGLACIAEGVETTGQVEELRGLGCDLGQGYLPGRPLPASLIGDFLSNDLSSWAGCVPQPFDDEFRGSELVSLQSTDCP